MASPYAEGVFLDAEGASLYAGAVCSEPWLNFLTMHAPNRSRRPKTLNLATMNLLSMSYWNLWYRELKFALLHCYQFFISHKSSLHLLGQASQMSQTLNRVIWNMFMRNWLVATHSQA